MLFKNNKQLSRIIYSGIISVVIISFFISFYYFFPLDLVRLNPINYVFRDFDYTDLYYSKLKPFEFEDEIVLINIQDADRIKIANALNEIQQFNPKSIGVDIIFEKLDPNIDSMLFLQLSKENVVVACSNLGRDIFDFVKQLNFGNISLIGDEDRSKKIRYFKNKTHNGELAFAGKINTLSNQNNYEADSQSDMKLIDYVGDIKSFKTFNIKQKSKLKVSDIQDKIILFGFFGYNEINPCFEDLHFTPLTKYLGGKSMPDTYGVVIHANILANLINNKYINTISIGNSWIIFSVFLYIQNFILFPFILLKSSIKKILILRSFQLTYVALSYFILYSIFHYFRIKIENPGSYFFLLVSTDFLYFFCKLLKSKIYYFQDN